MSFEKRDGKIWINGEMQDWNDVTVPLLSHGLHYGSGVFEGIRAYDGQIFKLHEHSQRLIDSAKIMDMEIPYSVEELDTASKQVLEINNLSDAYLRPIAWRGSEQMGVSAQEAKIHVAIATWEWPSYFSPEARAKGISLKTSKWCRPMPNSAPVHSKSTGLYMICTLSKHEAEAAGYDDALMLDYRGYVSEGTGANFFLIKDGILNTPTPDCFLNGITRQTVMQLAKDRGIEVVERFIKPEELKTADEIFVTGTAAEVTAVGKIDDLTFTVGPVTRQLRDDYENLTHGKPLRQVD